MHTPFWALWRFVELHPGFWLAEQREGSGILRDGVGIDLLLSSFWVFLMDLKSIQTTHSLFRDSRGVQTFTTRCQQAEFTFESKFRLLPVIWQSLPKAMIVFWNSIVFWNDSRRQSKVLTAKSMAKLMGQCSGMLWASRTGKHKHRTFPRWLQSLLAEGQLTWGKSATTLVLICYTTKLESQKGFDDLYISICDENFSTELTSSLSSARTCYLPKPGS